MRNFVKGGFLLMTPLLSTALTATEVEWPQEVILQAPVASSCQTAEEIKTHVINADHKAEAFCFHKVEHPAVTLKGGQAIATDMQLKQGLDVAFLNVAKNFAYVQSACSSLGAGWHAPLSNNQNATQRAAGNSSSLEAVGVYFVSTTNGWFWSSSTVSDLPTNAWYAFLPAGYPMDGSKLNSLSVVCVRQ